jgi:hypothetical protein
LIQPKTLALRVFCRFWNTPEAGRIAATLLP